MASFHLVIASQYLALQGGSINIIGEYDRCFQLENLDLDFQIWISNSQ